MTTSPPSTVSNSNIFTPPLSCLANFYSINVGSDAVREYTDRFNHHYVDFKGLETLDPNCFPEGFGWTTHTGFGTVSVGSQSILSPATCPFGYKSVGQTTYSNSETTVATCCFTDLFLTDITSNPASQSFSSWGAENTQNLLDWACAVESYYTFYDTATLGTVYAPQIVVTWQASDLSLFGAAATTSSTVSRTSAPVTSTPTAITTPTGSPSPSPALSTGSKAGIAVGVVLGVAILVTAAGLVWWRRRKSKKTDPRYEVEVTVEDSKPTVASKRVIRAEVDG